MYVCTCMHITTIKGKEAMDLKESKKGYVEGLERGKGRGKCCIHYNLQNKIVT